MAFLLKDYKDIKEIARGGMGKVYLATQISLGRKVIIKELATGLLTNATEIKRFENEARAAAALDHDNIIRIYDFGEDRGSFYISMEYIDGPDLETILKGPNYIQEIGLMIVLHALKGLNYAHEHRIIHRDIKPGNILVSKVGAVKVVDFGLAHASSREQMNLTATDMIVGTPLFMSPEQATGEEKKDGRMDIWSAGVLLYRILTGSYPFTGDNVPAILFHIVQSKQPPLHELAPAMPEGLVKNTDMALVKDRSKRLSSLAPIIESLQNYFFDIGIRDTAEQIRRYVTDPAASSKELCRLVIEYHRRKESEYEAAGDTAKAAVHREEARKYDSQNKPLTRVIDTIKMHTSSSLFSNSRSSWQPPSRLRIGMLALISTIILAAIVAGGLGLYFQKSKKTAQEQIAASPVTAPRRAASARSTDSSRKADSIGIFQQAANEKTQPETDRKKGEKKQQETYSPERKPSPAAAQPSAAGTLKVAISPFSADVFVDGEKLSAQEMSQGRQLKAGPHALTANAEGYQPYSKSVTVERGAVQIISADLAPLEKGAASVHIHSYPWAEIYIDDTFMGNSPTAKPIQVTAGPHTIILKRAGYKTDTESITVSGGELKRIKVQLVGE